MVGGLVSMVTEVYGVSRGTVSMIITAYSTTAKPATDKYKDEHRVDSFPLMWSTLANYLANP